jgi:CRP/FNR family transcriptional regulator, cyclic AMP receptor protein
VTLRPGSLPPSRIELFQGMPVFGAIHDDALQVLLDHASTVVLAKGEYFFHENDQASSMFVLESGRAAVIKRWQDRDYVLNNMVAGDCFGEMALLDLFPRSASVRAEEECHAIELAAADLLLLYEHDAEQFALIQMNIGREVSRRLRVTDELLFRALMGEKPADPETLFRAA